MQSQGQRATAGMLSLLVFLCLTVASFGRAQTVRADSLGGGDAKKPSVADLLPKEVVPIPAPPPLLIVSGVSCDVQGNIYLIYSDAPLAVLSQPSGMGIMSLPVQKIDISSKRTIQYPVPSFSGFQDPRRYHFFVDLRGKVYALFAVKEGATVRDDSPTTYIIVKYRDDGHPDSYVKLNTGGKKLTPIQFAVFQDGAFLVSGAVPQAQGPTAFSAVFDRDGTLIKDVKDVEVPSESVDVGPGSDVTGRSEAYPQRGNLANLAGVSSDGAREGGGGTQERARRVPPSPALTVGAGFVLIGPDGNAYMLRVSDPPRLYVVSPVGDVLNRAEVEAPSPGLAPLEMGMAGEDHIFIQFGPISTGAPVETQPVGNLVVLDNLKTLRADAVYRISSKDSGSITVGCASSPWNFSVVGTGTDNKLSVTQYAP